MISNLDQFIAYSKSFSVPEGKIESKEKGRLEFISRFPLASIQSLTVDEYCLGTTENSFCYWLEFKNILFGIGGGSAVKFGIYKSKDGNYYKHGADKIPLFDNAINEAFSKIKQDIVQGLMFIGENDIQRASSIQTSVWNMVLLKIFTIYYPDKFITIGDPDVIIECARNIGVTDVELKAENSILINYLCRQKLNQTKEFFGWGYEEIGTLVWETFRLTAKRNYYLIGSKYGENGDNDVFPEMLSRSVVATGFASAFDLTEFYNGKSSEVKEFLESQNEEGKAIVALKHFLSLKPGDLVAVKGSGSPKGKEGHLSIVGIAEVVEKNGKTYEYDPSGLGHIINVKFTNAPIFKELSLGGYGRAVHKLSNEDHIRLIFKQDTEMSYYEELTRFIAQADTDDLKTSSYLKSYSDLGVKVSFGQGNQSRVPWIAFLNGIDNVQNGIYPVYLLYKEKKTLILAYGVSETHTSERKWSISNEKTIEQFFKENNLGKPDRYGSSFVFKCYDLNNDVVKTEIDRDLNTLISIYKATPINSIINTKLTEKYNHLELIESISDAGLSYSRKLLTRFTASLLTKRFVILTGLSGSGKTKLAQAFVQWICNDDGQYRIVPVGADWTNREPLLGYPNALKPDEYVKPDSGVLELIVSANGNPDLPYFLILDEMNMSHVERYFADFLSVMESNEKIPLYAEGTIENGVPAKLSLPSNFFIIGTVNIDETTNMFSPKVLDRANTIEFRVTYDEMKYFLATSKDINMGILSSKGRGMGKDFLKMAANTSFAATNIQVISDTLVKFFTELKKIGAEFGYRSANEILRLINQLTVIDGNLTTNEKIDIGIIQKLLPKLHGSRRKLCPVLETLGSFCIYGDVRIIKDVFEKENFDFNELNVLYPMSLEKISRMYRGAIDNGFASFAEA